MGLMAPSATLTARARPFFTSSWRAMNSALPPSRMSVPRPAMLVAMVTMPERPGLRDVFGLALMLLGVEHHVADAFALQDAGEPFGFFN